MASLGTSGGERLTAADPGLTWNRYQLDGRPRQFFDFSALPAEARAMAEICRVLLSAFEPFDGADHNPSQDVVRELTERAGRGQLAAQRERGGIVVVPVLLPVEFTTAGQILTQAAREHSPDLVISVGLADGTDAIRLERVGLNLRDARIPDNAGAQPVDQPIIADGENALFSTLRLKAAGQRIAEANIPVSLSLSAGSYVCNDLLYTVLAHLRSQESGARAGFVHVPDLLATDAPITVDEAVMALDLLICESMSPAPDTHAAMGALH
ncbi:pyroglutamyl-peptidase I [Nesterenkonia natronophila]|uniref:Pyroglutamyl-peptidase I n=1 Tax=Nesterenkonia natronophila TaxID=2174932 RepID=A0A3A4G2M3_9MICC|nr:pyroglutamyl-peptidase I [Nesterenkonia natronophila]RJN32429.1 pyroglutamyl-peptidase I [Nesterenkonia natronophila]